VRVILTRNEARIEQPGPTGFDAPASLVAQSGNKMETSRRKTPPLPVKIHAAV